MRMQWLALFLGLSSWFLPQSQSYAQPLTELVEQNRAAIVNISTKRKSNSKDESHPLFRFFGPDSNVPREAGGSGFIIAPDGLIMTNAHVVRDADEIVVGLSDRRELEAEVIGSDKESDVALLRVKSEEPLPTVKLGDSDKLQVGQWVIAIGSPFGFDYSATQGIVSALGRSLPDETYVPFIQTDVAVNPGNSGGPLFNLDGEVVGINAQIFSRSGGYMGLSFSIPINLAQHVAEQLQSNGKVSRGWLGVLIQSINHDLAKSFGLEKANGALVSQVSPNSPAQAAGFQPGDIILEFNHKAIGKYSQLPNLVAMTKVGEEVPVNILRNGEHQVLKVTIQELPDDPKNGGITSSQTRLQVLVEDLDKDERSELGVKQGVWVKKIIRGGPAAQAGLRKGDIILKLNHQDIENVEQFETLVEQLPAGKPIPVLIQRGNGALFMVVELPQE